MAEQWAYQHNGDPEHTYDGGRPYADDVFQCYEPMCRSCHRKMDIAHFSPEQRAAFDEACRANATTARKAVDHTDPEYLAKMRLAGHKGGTARWAKRKG